mmetsp:Transcript_4209/g.10157  ORF Transcript_4209/g.10157 Transcript_4209/m.10157 type:complete len:164 (+) Transcript_4209:2449-2940(+)
MCWPRFAAGSGADPLGLGWSTRHGGLPSPAPVLRRNPPTAASDMRVSCAVGKGADRIVHAPLVVEKLNQSQRDARDAANNVKPFDDSDEEDGDDEDADGEGDEEPSDGDWDSEETGTDVSDGEDEDDAAASEDTKEDRVGGEKADSATQDAPADHAQEEDKSD